jgi:hypothetical protein
MNYSVTSTKARTMTVALLAFVTFTGALIPVAMFHELGHIVACNALGGRAILTGLASGGCLTDGQNTVIVRFAGGTFGTALALVPLSLWHKIRHNPSYRGILVGALALAFWDFEKAVLEAYSFPFYESYAGGVVMFIGAVVSAIVLFLVLNRSTEIRRT